MSRGFLILAAAAAAWAAAPWEAGAQPLPQPGMAMPQALPAEGSVLRQIMRMQLSNTGTGQAVGVPGSEAAALMGQRGSRRNGGAEAAPEGRPGGEDAFSASGTTAAQQGWR